MAKHEINWTEINCACHGKIRTRGSIYCSSTKSQTHIHACISPVAIGLIEQSGKNSKAMGVFPRLVNPHSDVQYTLLVL